MFSVIVGLIGIVLFVGLAIAGATYLGSAFRQSASASRAAALVQGAAQVSTAVDMYQLETGQTYTGDTSGLVGRYLKSNPVDPTTGAADYVVGIIGGNSIPAAIVQIGGSDAVEVCKAVNRQTLGSDAIPVGVPSNAGTPTLCYANRGVYVVMAAI